MQSTKELYNNRLRMTGKALKQPTYTHTVKTGNGDVKYYEFDLENVRLSGASDIVKVSIREDIMNSINFDGPIEIIGEVRTANIDTADGHSHLKVYAFVTEARNNDGENINEFEATTHLCRKPKYRLTSTGRSITDLTLACIRFYKNRSDYFPTIVWGEEAKTAKDLEIGQKLYIKGRFQSRQYIKKIGDAEIKRTAYEISTKSFEKLD